MCKIKAGKDACQRAQVSVPIKMWQSFSLAPRQRDLLLSFIFIKIFVSVFKGALFLIVYISCLVLLQVYSPSLLPHLLTPGWLKNCINLKDLHRLAGWYSQPSWAGSQVIWPRKQKQRREEWGQGERRKEAEQVQERIPGRALFTNPL